MSVGHMGEVIVRGKTLMERRDKEIYRSFSEWCNIEPFVVSEMSLYWAEIIKRIQEDKGLSISDLSEVCIMSKGKLKRVLAGEIKRSYTFVKILQALGYHDDEGIRKIVDQIQIEHDK